MYCRHCGSEGDTRFCGSCGRPMEELPISHRLTWTLDELRLTQEALASAELPG